MPRELIFSASAKNFRVDTFASGGPGGQHQNKTQSGVRITHIESGLSASCREGRSQIQNKKIAFERLCKLLVAHYVPKASKGKAPDVVVRNYHEPDDRITDKNGNQFSYKEIIHKNKAYKMINAKNIH